MRGHPTGTVTFLFTDIEGLTRLLAALGTVQYGGLLDEHGRVLRRAISDNNGSIFGTEGDALFAVFDHATKAVAAARDAQQALAAHEWPEDEAVRVRMGIHTTEASIIGGQYVGLGVHRVARICSAGHGGQVLVSSTTAAVLRDEGADVELVDLGEHRLKDLEQPEHLYQLTDPLLADTFPPLRTLPLSTNLPEPTQPIMGRERETNDVRNLILRPDVRLVTLTGPGGSGKTRLAVHVASRVLSHFGDGVFFVPLADTRDPDLVRSAIAQTLKISRTAGQSLAGFLSDKQLLLVVDNFEQVADAASQMTELLRESPKLKIMVTSREALHVVGEHLYPVPPLGLPDPAAVGNVEAVGESEAVALFVERARSVDPHFILTRENAATIAEICSRLDGLPLAIELAAARIPLLTPAAMLERLDERLQLLTTGPKDLPERQRTLRGAMAWSYDLLAETERQLFSCLGVFAGGWSLEASEAVCGADLDTLAALIDKSLIRRSGDRFDMLQTVRVFASERLADRDDSDSLRERHAAFFQDMAERVYPARFSEESQVLSKLQGEHENLRTAFDRLTTTDPVRCLTLAGALGWFWLRQSHLDEGRTRLGQALELADAAPDEIRARGLAAAGALAAWQGAITEAEQLLHEAEQIWRKIDDHGELALTLYEAGWATFFKGDDPAAKQYMEESLVLEQTLDRPLVANRTRLGLAQVLVSMGQIDAVEELATEALGVAQRLGHRHSIHLAHHFLADAALLTADFEAAEVLYRQSLADGWHLGDQIGSIFQLQGVAMAASGQGSAEEALRLLGAAEAQKRFLGARLSVPFWDRLLDLYEERAREELGAQATQAFEDGAGLGFERVVAEVIRSGHAEAGQTIQTNPTEELERVAD